MIAVLIWRTNDFSPFLYQGGMVLLSIATVIVITALVHPATKLGRALGWRPLRWIGVRSYGIYLWHVPDHRPHDAAPLQRRGSAEGDAPGGGERWAGRALVAVHRGADPPWALSDVSGRGSGCGRGGRHRFRYAVGLRWPERPLVLLLAALGLSGVTPPTHFSSLAASISVGSGGSELPPSSASGGPADQTSTLDPATAASGRTSCHSVAYIGDSTSEGMISTDYLPQRAERLGARLARVGATRQHLEITGATSIVETLPGGTNAYEVARGLVDNGFDGCWVIALGTNDSADVYVGSSVDLDTRINRMMSVIGHQPVLWVTAKSLLAGGPYSEGNMERWNSALMDACPRTPT